MLSSLRPANNLPLRRFFCKCSSAPDPLSLYRDSFAQRMAMAGIKPHHRIALGVSGGPDSTALCVLTARWKSEGLGLKKKDDDSGYIDGLLGIIVDHKLRPESTEEAEMVRQRVSNMGVKCVIKSCNWSGGRPKLGHLQEAARDMRYQNFHSVCIEQQIAVLLVAHHADDQAELFLLRLSRNSGVLGLAGMAFISQFFPTHSRYCPEGNQGILLVRPMLEFTKDDMYKICECGYQEWVEDPTNQQPLFARNRFRILLKNISSNIFRLEIQRLLAACQLTRSFIQNVCHKMIEECVTITDHGYAIIDLEKLESAKVEDVCLSKFLAMILQFISQRHRPIRGGASQLVLDYVRKLPCKTSLTAAGCYLSPAPRSKGTQILVCFHSTQPSSMSSYQVQSCSKPPHLLGDIHQIIKEAKTYTDQSAPKAYSVHFLHTKSSEDVLNDAKKLNLISESTLTYMRSLQMEEYKKFNSKQKVESSFECGHDLTSAISHVVLHHGESCHFMSRFLVSWGVPKVVLKGQFYSGLDNLCLESGGDHNQLCQFCMTDHVSSISVRHMVDADWLYLSKVSKGQSLRGREDHVSASIPKVEQKAMEEIQCSSYMQLSAQRALKTLKYIPVSARKALPVVVNTDDLLLCIPSVGFSCCPHLLVTAEFRPRVPLGGGYIAYI